MPHIIGSGEIPGCITELFESDEVMHDKIETMDEPQKHKAEALEKELQAFVDEALKKVESFQARVDELNA